MPNTILVVDDDAVQHRLLRALLESQHHHVVEARSGDAAMAMMTGPDGAGIDLILLDLIMPKMDGFEVMKRLRAGAVDRPIIVLTARGTIDTVVEAMRAGADDFVPKPVNPQRLLISIGNLLKLRAVADAYQSVKRKNDTLFRFDDLIAQSTVMAKPIALGQRAAQSSIPVLLEGESGVGKEVFARAVQGSGSRAGKPFVTVNCGAIPENLVESLLFGHEKGAFTGAHQRRAGKFQEADGGTLFLDEIGELPFELQVKLLRALQEGEIEPVGANVPVKVDFRLISATNRSLASLVEAGSFREDLFYRLNAFPVFLPPLRERRDDIVALAERFMAHFSLEEGKKVNTLTAMAARLLRHYDWPGNVRQLENAVYRAVVLTDGPELTPDVFPRMVIDSNPDLFCQEEPQAVIASPDDGHLCTLEQLEREHIARALRHYEGRSEIAQHLGISRTTLYRKIRHYEL